MNKTAKKTRIKLASGREIKALIEAEALRSMATEARQHSQKFIRLRQPDETIQSSRSCPYETFVKGKLYYLNLDQIETFETIDQ